MLRNDFIPIQEISGLKTAFYSLLLLFCNSTGRQLFRWTSQYSKSIRWKPSGQWPLCRRSSWLQMYGPRGTGSNSCCTALSSDGKISKNMSNRKNRHRYNRYLRLSSVSWYFDNLKSIRHTYASKTCTNICSIVKSSLCGLKKTKSTKCYTAHI